MAFGTGENLFICTPSPFHQDFYRKAWPTLHLSPPMHARTKSPPLLVGNLSVHGQRVLFSCIRGNKWRQGRSTEFVSGEAQHLRSYKFRRERRKGCKSKPEHEVFIHRDFRCTGHKILSQAVVSHCMYLHEKVTNRSLKWAGRENLEVIGH